MLFNGHRSSHSLCITLSPSAGIARGQGKDFLCRMWDADGAVPLWELVNK